MQFDLYKSNSNSSKFLVVRGGQSLHNLILDDSDFKQVSRFKLGFNIHELKPAIGFDYQAAVTAINSVGFYIQRVIIEVTVS
ncbi:MAG TPA: hypothetical protein VES38_02940 [Methylotenera sp.]|nr:hypothetical protein [Methylotenera sp.]